VGDRSWAIRDEESGALTGAKKLPSLMHLEARFVEEPRAGEAPERVRPVVVRFPDGSEAASGSSEVHDRLSDHVKRRVRLVPLAPVRDRAHYRARQASESELRQIFELAPGEPLPDLSMLPLALLAELALYATPRGTHFDCFPLHVLTTASVEALRALAPGSDFDVRRFRPNLLLETDARDTLTELAWCGGTLDAGSFRARIETPTPRCSMPSRSQPGLAADPRIMKTIAAHAERCLGVYASIAKPGRVQVGDRVDITLPSRSLVGSLGRAGRTASKRLLLRTIAKLLPES
jgi:uncharacterized protein YcbX